MNPYYVKDFARSYRDLAKTDKIDAQMLSELNPRIQERKEDYLFDLEELTKRLDLLVETMKEVSSWKRAERADTSEHRNLYDVFERRNKENRGKDSRNIG